MGISESLDNSDVPAEHMHRRVYVCVRVWMLIARVKYFGGVSSVQMSAGLDCVLNSMQCQNVLSTCWPVDLSVLL